MPKVQVNPIFFTSLICSCQTCRIGRTRSTTSVAKFVAAREVTNGTKVIHFPSVVFFCHVWWIGIHCTTVTVWNAMYQQTRNTMIILQARFMDWTGNILFKKKRMESLIIGNVVFQKSSIMNKFYIFVSVVEATETWLILTKAYACTVVLGNSFWCMPTPVCKLW